jgi:hypothetical protein
MSVGTKLSDLRRMLRAEVGQSLNPAQGSNAQGQYDMMLDRTQRELWEQYEWPHLFYYTDLAVQTGQRFYDYPVGMPFDAILRGHYLDSGTNWLPLGYQIGLHCYSQYGGESGRAWPPQRWQNVPQFSAGKTIPVGKLELWPVPAQNGTLRFNGQALVNALVSDNDVAVLDDTLITLFTAAEILAAQKGENASLKLQKANQYLRRLMANIGGMKRTHIPILGGYGSSSGHQGQTPGIDYIPVG